MTENLLLGVILLAQPPGPATAADAVTFRDGRILLGQVLDAAPRKPLRVAVRRDWARAHLPDRAALWEKAEASTSARAREQRLARLTAWRPLRPADPKDRVGAWIDAEIGRLQAGGGTPVPLLVIEIPPTQIRQLDRRPDDAARLLRQAWRAGLDDPETRPLDDLHRLLEGRGVALSDVDPAPLDELIALPLESETTWLTRRAATEVLNDEGLRFAQYQGLILPENARASPANLAAAAAATLKGLLGDEPAEDPLAGKLQAIEAQGKVGVVLTRLELGDDLASATIASALLVRLAPGHWAPAVFRPATVRADDVPADAVAPVANDPQVKTLFGLFEMLLQGGVGQDIQQRTTNVGAATKQALGLSQSALTRDLESLTLPVNR
jgi:hypothetical protein